MSVPIKPTSMVTSSRDAVWSIMKAMQALNAFNSSLKSVSQVLSTKGFSGGLKDVTLSLKSFWTGWQKTTVGASKEWNLKSMLGTTPKGAKNINQFVKNAISSGVFQPGRRGQQGGFTKASPVFQHQNISERIPEIGAFQELMGMNPLNIPMDAFAGVGDYMKYQLKWLAEIPRAGAAAVGGTVGRGLAPAGSTMMGSLGLASKIATFPLQLLGQTAKGIGTMAGKMVGLKPESMAKMGEAFKSIGGGITQMGMMAVLDVLMQLLSALNPFKPLLDALTTIFSVYGEIISTAFLPIIEQLFNAWLSPEAIELVTMFANALAQVVMMTLPLIDLFVPLGAVILQALLVVLQALTPVILLVIGVFTALMPLIVTLITLFIQIWNVIAPLLLPVIDILVGALMVVANAMSGVLTIALTLLVDAIAWVARAYNQYLAPIWTLIVNAFKWVYNGVVSVINAIIDVLNDLDVLDVIPNIPKMPMLASGGIVTSPTIAMIGEAGPEAVVPLDRMGSSGIGGTTIIINGDVTEEMLYKMNRDVWLRSLS